jgi:inorganic triphosphatase YgiF
MPPSRELELKLAIAPEDVARLQLDGPLAKKPSSCEHQESIYFDTPGHELRKAGLSLRVRRSGGSMIQTIKTRANGTGLFDRDEWEMPVRTMKPHLNGARAGPIARLFSEGNESDLDQIARIKIDRTNWRIAGADDLIEISLDQGAITAGGSTKKVSGIELELKQGSKAGLFDLCETLGKRVPLRLDVLSKAEIAEALAEGGLDRPAKAGRINLASDMTVAEGFTQILLSCLRHLRLNEDLLVNRRVPEALHQLRVAIRRIRSAFALFRPIVRGRACQRLESGLRRFGSQFGEVRNLDAFIELVDRDSPPFERIRLSRELAYDRIVALLESPRFPRLMMRLLRWTLIGKWRRRPDSSAPLESFLTWRLDKSWARICELGPLLSTMGEKERHRFRIRVKEFRYALDFARGLHRGTRHQRKPFRYNLEELQEDLGLLNDRRVARRLAVEYRCLVPAHAEAEGKSALLMRAECHFGELAALGPYWRESGPRPREAGAVRPRGAAGPPGASRTRGPRSGGCARG